MLEPGESDAWTVVGGSVRTVAAHPDAVLGFASGQNQAGREAVPHEPGLVVSLDRGGPHPLSDKGSIRSAWLDRRGWWTS